MATWWNNDSDFPQDMHLSIFIMLLPCSQGGAFLLSTKQVSEINILQDGLSQHYTTRCARILLSLFLETATYL